MKKGLVVTMLLAFCVESAVACGEFDDWHLLPQIGEISFVNDKVVLQPITVPSFYSVPEERTFTWFPDEQQLKVVYDATLYGLPDTSGTVAAPGWLERMKEAMSLEITSPYCAEGEELHRRVTYKGREVELEFDPCLSITALGHDGDRLYLGSSYVGECGMQSQGGGIEIRTVADWKLAGKIPADELPGEMVRAVAVNPQDKTLWVATEQGLAQFDSDYQKLWQGYYCEEIDSVDNRPFYSLLGVGCQSDDFATLSRLLDVENINRYHRQVAALPAEVRRELMMGRFFMSGPSNEHPTEMNFLVDYFIDAYLKGDEWTREFALWNICNFNDPAARTFMLMMDARPVDDRQWNTWRRNCAIREQEGRWWLNRNTVKHTPSNMRN